MKHEIAKILRTVMGLKNRSGPYESLLDDVPEEKEVKVGHSFWRRSKVHCLPGDIPRGYLAVYVSTERKRYVISAKYLSHQLFKELLKQSEEEFGYDHQGGLNLACEIELFEHLLWLVGTNSPSAATTHLKDLISTHERAEGR